MSQTLPPMTPEEEAQWVWRIATFNKTVAQNKWIPESVKEGLNKNSKQKQFLLLTDIKEIFYGGSVGGGKAGLMATPCNAAKFGYNPSEEIQMEEFRMRLGHKVLTPFGFKLIDDMEVGDQVCNPDGTTVKVIAVHDPVVRECYRIKFVDGAECVVSHNHLWAAKISGKRTRRKVEDPYQSNAGDSPQQKFNTELMRRYKLVTTDQLAEIHAKAESESSDDGRPLWVSIPLTEPVNFQLPPGRSAMAPPYTLGIILGDGSTQFNPRWMKPDEFVPSEVQREMIEYGFTDEVGEVPSAPNTYSITGGEITNCLRSLGLQGKLSHEKFIPEKYLNGPIKIRRSLLQGLMDTDGSVDQRGHCSFSSTSRALIDGVRYLCQSLGYIATVTDKPEPKYTHNGEEKVGRPAWSLYITGRNRADLFRGPNKRDKTAEMNNEGGRRIVSVEKLDGEYDTRCITVDHPNGLYLTNEFIVTHNTYATLCAATQYVDVPGYAALLLRENYGDLNKPGAWMDLSRQWWYGKGVDWNERDRVWRFPSGATITFGYLDSDSAVYQYDGASFQYIAVDELTQHSLWRYQFMFGRLRRPKVGDIGQVPIRMRSTSNPGNKGHLWVKKRFIDRDTREPGAVYVPATLVDNSANLDVDEYRKSLANLDPLTRAQREKGDWDAIEGGRFKAEWFGRWKIDRALRDTMVLTSPAGAEVERFRPELCGRFQTCDPAASTSARADFFVLSTWLITPRANVVWWGCHRGKHEIQEQVATCQRLYRKYHPQFVGVEELMNQKALAQILRRSVNPVMAVRSVSPMGKDKLNHAAGYIALAASGRVFVPERPGHDFPLEDVMNEHVRFTGDPKSDGHDDTIDSGSYMADLLPFVRNHSGAAPSRPFQRYTSEVTPLSGLK